MWDRRNYRDTDFGLLEDETFEPPDARQADELDLTQPYIMSVLGPIVPDQLGICQPHEHILCDPVELTGDVPDYCLDRIDLACEDLEAFLTVGGSSLVDATTIDYGRDLAGLRSIGQRLPVNIVAVTGRHQHAHAARMSNSLEEGSIERELLADINAEIKPGLIVAGTSLGEITNVERVAVLACANVAARAGYPLAVQLAEGTMAHEALDLVEAAGLSPSRVILGRLDGRLDFDYLSGIAERGVFLSFNRISDGGRNADVPKAAMLVRLAQAGYEDRLLISQGLSRRSELIAYGGSPGWIYLPERFVLELMRAGGSAEFVRTLIIDNPANALTIRPRLST